MDSSVATTDLPVLTRLEQGVPRLIDTEAELALAIRALAASSLPVAIDTERAQGYRYGSEAWVVQVRRADAGTFLIDSHALPHLEELGRVLQATWIFHAASQDLPPLADLGMVAPSIFDTEIAARLLGAPRFSLLAVCEQFLGMTLKKAHQNENWSIRPLPTDWLRYAAMDVEVLPPLERELRRLLEEEGRWDWAEQEFEFERTHLIQPKENRWENLKGIGKLRKPQQLAIAKELWEVRERIAVLTDLAPTRILSNRAVLDAALTDPTTRRGLQTLPEFRRPRPRQHLDEWWEALRRAHSLTPEEMPRLPGPDTEGVPPLRQWKRLRPDALSRLQEVRDLVASVAEPLGLEPDVVVEPKIQREVAWDRFRSPADILDRLEASAARPWQVDLVRASEST